MHTRQSASNLKGQNLEKYSFRTRDHLPSPLSFSIFDRKDEDAEKKEGKPYEVSLVLAVVVKKLVGNMTVKIKEPLQTACGTPSPPSPNARSGIFTDAFACPTTMTTTATTTVINDEASVKVDESLLLPYSFGGTLNDRKTWFGRKADDYLILGRTMTSLASIQATRFVEGVLVLCLKACGRRFHGWYGAHQDCFVGNQPLDGAPVAIQLEHIVLSLELQLSPKCTTSPKGLHNALVINLFDMCDNKYIR
ncbi:hypothetical protein M422DRAFT_257671 [Sphaerobolus stellatus SS14]|uniref:Uncharacterized protein n=1 Tax=Sphaerobolus stellatus (strain SS14) TaxID=990650 RepID=A0A0C9VP53_SPHS4|nr:hypothetical protein M422DRAFT_257671 [Sphaerobolus stellatus SS14]